MNKGIVVTGLLASLAIGGGAAGCSHDKPDEYGERRPPVTELDGRDRGLQSKDVVQASEQMAMSLLGDPRLNESKDQWTIVVGNMRNQTVSARHGKGRVTLIQNRADYRDRQAGELEIEPRADAQPGAKGVQPDYQLDGTIMELPNRGTSYYLMEFSVNDLHNRTIPWTDAYEVRVER